MNYSFKAIFSAWDRELDKLSSIQQEEIDQIFQRISQAQAQLSKVDVADEAVHDGYANWYWNNGALMESCRAGTSCSCDTTIFKLVNLY